MYYLCLIYKKRYEECNSFTKKYIIFEDNVKKIAEFDNKYEVKIYLDMLNLCLGKPFAEKYLIKNFQTKDYYGNHEIIGRSFHLKHKRQKTKV